MSARPATSADLRAACWHVVRGDFDWIDTVRALRWLAALDAAEAGDPAAWVRVTRLVADLAVESGPDGADRLVARREVAR